MLTHQASINDSMNSQDTQEKDAAKMYGAASFPIQPPSLTLKDQHNQNERQNIMKNYSRKGH